MSHTESARGSKTRFRYRGPNEQTHVNLTVQAHIQLTAQSLLYVKLFTYSQILSQNHTVTW